MAKNTNVKKVSAVSQRPLKGENFYLDKTKLKRRNLLKSGKPTRNSKGVIVRDAEYAKRKPDTPVVRVEPNRKWFGNTRTMTIDNIEKFRMEMAKKKNDPYQVLLHQNKLPMSLLMDPKKSGKINLLEVESFSSTFGKTSLRKRPKLAYSSFEDLMGGIVEPMVAEVIEQDPLLEDSVDMVQDQVFKKGQSKRIWNELYKVIDSSDVVVHVLDSRDPLGTLCKRVEKFLENEAKHKHLVYLLNKCDLVPTSVTSRWIDYFSKKKPTIAYRASINNSYGKGSLISLLRQYSKLHPERKQISVGFIGYPNTGKSSVINSLKRKKVCSVAPIPGQTKVWQYVTLMKRIYLIDCPGVVPHSHEDSETELVLKGAIRVENIKDPEDHVASVLQRVKREYIAKAYSVSEWEDPLDFMAKLARLKGKLLKGGEPDISTTAKIILNDFIRGELPYFMPPPISD